MIKDSRGFSMLEVLFSLLILGLISSTMMPSAIQHLQANSQSEIRSQAVAVAQQVLDQYRRQDISQLPSGAGDTISEQISLDGHDFEVISTFCEDSDLCQSGGSRQITVEVSFRGETRYEVDTVYTQLR